MTSIQQFKNKLQGFQEGTDYIYNENKRTYTIHHEELKNAFWGDVSKEVEYKAIEDNGGNIHFRKSITFRSSSSKETKRGMNYNPSTHSIEKIHDKQWLEKNLGTFSKVSKNDFQTPIGFKKNEEEFGYYQEWKPGEEPTNVLHYQRGEGTTFIKRVKVWKDDNSQVSEEVHRIQEITNEEAEEIAVENSLDNESMDLVSYKGSDSKKGSEERNQIIDRKINNNSNSSSVYWVFVLIALVLVIVGIMFLARKMNFLGNTPLKNRK